MQFEKFCQIKYSKFFIGIFLVLNFAAFGVDEQLNQLSLEEKESLEYFFSTAIKNDHLGHVLFFSNKPACLLGRLISEKQTQNDKLFLRGWQVWQEKERDFPHPNFIIHHETVDFGNGKTALHIYFINKKTLAEILTKNECCLKEILEEKFSKDDFISDLEEKHISSLFYADQALLGILLGYGIESSKAFKQHKKDELSFILCSREGKVDFSKPQKASLTCVLKKESILPVTFFGDASSKEVQQLQEKYAKELDQIEAIFNKKELLKLSLQALCNDAPL